MAVWRTLLIVYRELDARLALRSDFARPKSSRGRDSVEPRQHRFRHVLSETEIADALDSFAGFPELVKELTDGAAEIQPRLEFAGVPLKSLTFREHYGFWPSPDDTRAELNHFAASGMVDSVFVYWPQHDFAANSAVPGSAWGLGMGANAWSHGATYATVSNARTEAWKNEARGEVWLHEWLHGVCHHFAELGYLMPQRDADGAEIHGYIRSASRGWTDYYRDLMQGTVDEDGGRLGIPLAAWQESTAGSRFAMR